MPFWIRCPMTSSRMLVGGEMVGRMIHCPRCRQTHVVPEPRPEDQGEQGPPRRCWQRKHEMAAALGLALLGVLLPGGMLLLGRLLGWL